MKKKFLKFVTTLLAVCMATTLFVGCGGGGSGSGDGDTSTPGLIFVLVEGKSEYRLVDAGNEARLLKNITIPATYNDLPVTEIGTDAFYGYTAVESVTLPSSIKVIGEEAFSSCENLKSITLPNGLKSIGKEAFADCYDLTSVSIPDSVTDIGLFAFDSCESLTYTVKDNVEYLGNSNNPYLYLNGAVQEHIGEITSLVIDSRCKFIGEYAFSGCYDLASVTLPDGIISIGDEAFSNCYDLTYNEYGVSKYLGSATNQHLYLVGPQSMNVGSAEAVEGCKIIASNAFSGCKNLTDFNIANTVTSIGSNAFEECTNLLSITIPDSVTSIGDSVFEGCTRLSSAVIGNGLTIINEYTFGGCTSLTNVTIGNGVKTIGWEAFYNCSSLANLTIPSSVILIHSCAFEDCISLTNVTFEDTTSTWYRTSEHSDYLHRTNSLEIDVTNSSSNAQQLKTVWVGFDLVSCYWYKV